MGDTASHLGGDGAIAGELGGVPVQAEEGVGGDDDFDVGSPSVLVGESAAEPVESVAQDVFEQVCGDVGAPLFAGPVILDQSRVLGGSRGVRRWSCVRGVKD
ncbi:hypothetical protein OG555_22725 [Kribbella sp. NBC_01484]|nr:hypothetical protein [Kribbella sp. NBC_01484]